MAIAARNARDWPSGVQRFVISGGKLGNRCRVLPVYDLFAAVILDFRARLANRCSSIVVAVEDGLPATVVAATMSASDSNREIQKATKGY